jgi:hypothetical protein
MMAICGAQGRIKDNAYLHHIYCKVKNWIQRENQIIQSDQDVHKYGCDGYGKVDTSPGAGASYYHQIYWNSFLHDTISLLFLSSFGHGLSLFFLHALSLVFFTYALEHVFFFPFFA